MKHTMLEIEAIMTAEEAHKAKIAALEAANKEAANSLLYRMLSQIRANEVAYTSSGESYSGEETEYE